MTARPGMTLVEGALAGALAVLLTLSLLEGVVVATRIAHENSECLAADSLAWDVAWKWLNKKYEDLPAVTSGQIFSTDSSANRIVWSDDLCPVLRREATGGAPTLVVKVTLCKDATGLLRHGQSVEAKRIDVDVAWGPAGNRTSLNGLADARSRSLAHPVTVYKCAVDRGVEGAW